MRSISKGLSLFILVLSCVGLVNARNVRVVATTEDLAAIARAVGGGKVDVVSLVRGDQDPHYLQVRPSDMIKVSRADLFVMVGLDLESWVGPVLDGARNPKVRPGAPGFVDASVGIEPMEVPSGKVDRSQGDIHPRGNPHYWLDPSNIKIVAGNIAEGLMRISPKDQTEIKSNLEKFVLEMDSAISRWKELASPLRQTPVITYHKTWSYFARAFGLKVVNYVEPRAGIPPSPKHIQDLMSQIRRENIPVLITEPYFDIRLSERISQSTGARLVILAPSIGAVKGPRDTLELMEYNLNEILKALKEAQQK